MIAIDALLAGAGLIIDHAAEGLGVVDRSVRRSLDILRELAGPTVFGIGVFAKLSSSGWTSTD